MVEYQKLNSEDQKMFKKVKNSLKLAENYNKWQMILLQPKLL